MIRGAYHQDLDVACSYKLVMLSFPHRLGVVRKDIEPEEDTDHFTNVKTLRSLLEQA